MPQCERCASKTCVWIGAKGRIGLCSEYVNPLLAKKHTGMRVDHSGILGRISAGCKVRPDQRYILGEMDKHLEEMARRFYGGEITAVDEFLQLYCLDEHRPGDAA